MTDQRKGPRDRRIEQHPACAECGHFGRFHERILDPEEEPHPYYFWFCHECKREGKSYPATHHAPHEQTKEPR